MPLLDVALCLSAALAAQREDNPALDPREAKPGVVYQWKASDGLAFEYRVPEGYDAARGANLTLVLHGNGLDHRWTFWNHPAGEFRAQDVVVSPDGTSPYGGANEFLGEAKDAQRLHALLGELKRLWNVRSTFLYGHSQGSFFAFYYAGEYPEDVNGVCGHASGAWGWTTLSKAGHHQAIGVLHGTEDHIPYAQAWDTAQWYRERGYPLVHLRTLFGWNHRPHWMQAASVLAWCEGMTSADPGRVAASLETLADPGLALGANWSAAWAVADRLAGMEQAGAEDRARGKAVASAIDALASAHAASIEEGLRRKGKLVTLTEGAWAGELTRFLEEFDGVPAAVAFEAEYKKELDGLRKTARSALEVWHKDKVGDRAHAFAAALDALEHGFLDYQVPAVIAQCRDWLKTGAVEVKKQDRAQFEDLAEIYEAARVEGFAAFEKRGAEAKL